MLDVLEDFLLLRGISFARLDGSTRRPRRSLDIKLVIMPIFCYCYKIDSSYMLQFQQETSRKNASI